jgi:hypothetical protein
VIDNAWSATFDWLAGWCKLPVERNPHLPQSIALFNLVFGEALTFTKLPYKIEWQQSKLRLDAIEREGHDKTFKQLGGTAFFAHLTEAQAAYGIALHITAPKPPEAPAAEVHARLDAALFALRDYAARVAAYADPDLEGSDALAEALLAPLSVWESSNAPAAGGDEEGSGQGEVPAPAEPPAGTRPASDTKNIKNFEHPGLDRTPCKAFRADHGLDPTHCGAFPGRPRYPSARWRSSDARQPRPCPPPWLAHPEAPFVLS